MVFDYIKSQMKNKYIDMNDNKYCSNYNKHIDFDEINMVKGEDNDIKKTSASFNYYYFDVVSCDEVYINIYRSNINYKSDFCINSYMKNSISLINRFRVYDNLIIDTISNKSCSYKYYNKYKTQGVEDNDEWDFYYFFTEIPSGYLYTDNLEELKNTSMYKYTKLWMLKDIFATKKINILDITYNPLYHKEFEYLVNLKLYSLALSFPEEIKFKGNFIDTFGLEKKYYKFMVENDIDSDMYKALKIYKTDNLKLLKLIGYYIDLINDSKMDKKTIKKVFDKLGDLFLKDESLLFSYLDYYSFCLEIKLDLDDNNVLFPKDFNKAYNEVYTKYLLLNNKDINNKLNAVGDMLDFNKYEDDKYIIYPPHNLNDLIEESFQMHNCVRTYYDNILYSNSQVYFLREKDKPDKSLVTIEVIDNSVTMALGKYNNEIEDKNILNVINNWESNLVNVEV
ncbi:MAG: PcfJ domain-containing protein [Bacilli bacterium]|nr:PcfJ domain-containing protein [Bacilli bacterium]